MEKQCKKCGEIKPIEQFSTNGLLPNGDKYYVNRCMECHNAIKRLERSKQPYRKQPTGPGQLIKEDLILEKKKEGCSQCGYNEYMFCIDLHHINPSTKHPTLKVKRAGIRKLSIPDLIEELKICTPLCKMCHAKVHAGIIKL